MRGRGYWPSGGQRCFCLIIRRRSIPRIVCSQLLRYVDVSPLVTEGYFKIPVVAQVLHLMNAVRVPDLEKSRRGVEIVAGLNRVVIDALAAGHNVLLYPAGQLTDSRV
ncbi:MAG: hypothetical protein V8R91_21275, partial [Butyricimonas faecihominis]